MSQVHQKDPEAIRTFGIDYSVYLSALGPGMVIASSDWAVPDDITEVGRTVSDTFTSIKLSGGTVNKDYTLYNKITTNGGDVDRRAIIIEVRDAVNFGETSDNEKALLAVRAVLSNKATKDQQEMQIGNRMIKRYAMTELLALETRLTQLVNREHRSANVKKGWPFFNNIHTRFGSAR